jgi:diguanylate cyclase (GGDEF)-like protein
MHQLDPNRDTNHRYHLRLALRCLIIFSLIFFISKDFIGYGLVITLSTLFLYLLSLLLRNRNKQASDLLLTLGDVPALAGVVHLPSHVFAFEALIPGWLIGTTIANLRKGQPSLLPLHSLVAWLVLATHAPTTAHPWGYLLVQTLAIVVASLVALAMVLERRVHRTDGLTGILTRRAGLEELQQLKPKEGGTTLAFIDLRHFKAINDQHGHAAGDEVLAVVAKRIANVLRKSDVLFRYGGDEFIVASQAPDLETRLRNVFTEPVKTKQAVLHVEARIGIQHETGKIDVDAIVKEADRRMYADSRKMKEQPDVNLERSLA